MTYEIYRTIFIVFTILAIVTLLVAVILFFALKIPKVVGDLSGINAKKAIESIRNQNAESADRTDTPGIGLSRKIAVTGKISTQKLMGENANAYQMSGANETTVLSDLGGGGNETTILSEMPQGMNETTILSEMPQAMNETTVLSAMPTEKNNTEMLSPEKRPAYGQQSVFEIEFEITYIHTNEIIA